MSNGISRCRHCGEVIGVYEPMIVLRKGQVCRTSRAAEISSSAIGKSGECYHDECYARAGSKDASSG